MAYDREVGGIRCSEVLGVLDDYIDGELSSDVQEKVNRHLASCNWCEQFGGHYVGTIRALRAQILEELADAEASAEIVAKIERSVSE